MAVRIPTYERHVQLDSGAQTIPRYHAATETGKALAGVGNSLIALGAHFQKKQEQFDTMQLNTRLAIAKQQADQIVSEETNNYDPTRETPGTLHDRINSRVSEVYNGVLSQTPQHLQPTARLHVQQSTYTYSTHAATQESKIISGAATAQLDKIVAGYKQAVAGNPDGAPEAIKAMRASVDGMKGSFSDGQRSVLSKGYEDQIAEEAIKGFQTLKQFDKAKAFAGDYAKQRDEVYGSGRVSASKPGTSSVDPSKYNTKLTSEEAKGFAEWKAKNAPNDSGHDYDLPGAYKAGVERDPETGHMPDTFKKPNHPTFSDQSQYAKDRPDLAGHWEGETFVPPKPQNIAPGPQSQLNAKRIAQIDAMPEVKAAIEKAAADNGLDPNQLKVFASIESSGNPKDVTGSHKGLFNLTTAEFGMFNGGKGNILDANDNAQAAAKVLAQKKDQLTTQLGREPTPTELYGAHNQGMGGVSAHIQNPDQPAWKSMLSTKEGQDKIEEKGQAGAERWAKSTIDGNVPSDVTKRLYGGDSTQITSKEFMAIQGTRVKGGNIDEAITSARMGGDEPPQVQVASRDGGVVSDTRSPSYVGGIESGQQPAPTIAGYRAASEVKLDEAGAHGYTRGGTSVAPWLVDSVRAASQTLPPGYHAKIISTVDARSTGTVWHPSGRAIDIQIYDENNKPIPNVGPPGVPGYDVYKNMAAAAKTYAEDKYGKNMTWGGHFNTGTPFDRMHFQVGGPEGGGSARSFTPDELANGRTAIANVGSGTPVQVAQLGQTDSAAWLNSKVQQIDGSRMKADSINSAFKKSLNETMASDVASRRDGGVPVQLSQDLQKYYGTDKLSYELISNHLGEGNAIAWEQAKEQADRDYQAGAHMKEMPASDIQKRVEAMQPVPGSPDYTKQAKTYEHVLKEQDKILKARDADPAKAADEMSDVKNAKDEYLKNPTDENGQKLVAARMKTERYLEMDDATLTPLTNQEASHLAKPLSNKGILDPSGAANAAVTKLRALVGDDEDTLNRGLSTILKQKGINETSATLMSVELSKQNKQPAASISPSNAATTPPAPKSMFPTNVPTLPTIDPLTGMAVYPGEPAGAPDTYADVDRGLFDPTKADVVPGDRVRALLKNPTVVGPELDREHGSGASAYFIQKQNELVNKGEAMGMPAIAQPGAELGPVNLPGEEPNKDPYTPSDDEESSGAL